MPDYRIRWEIDLTCDTAAEAATYARTIQNDPDSIATVFEVHDKDANTWETVDTADINHQLPAAAQESA